MYSGIVNEEKYCMYPDISIVHIQYDICPWKRDVTTATEEYTQSRTNIVQYVLMYRVTDSTAEPKLVSSPNGTKS